MGRLLYLLDHRKECAVTVIRRALMVQQEVRFLLNMRLQFVEESGFSCMVDILLKLDRLGAVITEAPLILRYDRKPGKSKMNVGRTMVLTLRILGRHRFGRVK